jgi:hypothetical protein
LLRMRPERPSSRRAAEKCDEFASPHWPAGFVRSIEAR